MKKITSPDNALVKKALKLQNPRNRDAHERCLVEGLRAVETFLDSPYKIARLYVTEKHLAWAQQQCEASYIVLVTSQIIQKISIAATPSGIIGMFTIPAKPNLQELDDGIVLAQIQDPGNMGTLIRTATALGKSIVIIESVNPYNPKVIQASAGTLAHAKIFRTSWEELNQKKHDLSLAALVVTNGTPIMQVDKNKKRLLVVGNEAHGLPQNWQADCDEKITLPMPGGTESLNAAIAGSIALYMLHSQEN